jgi:hypothetical protein
VYLRNPGILLSVGMICLAAAILLKRFGGQSGKLAFIEGMLIGVSLVFNIAYLVITRRERDSR